MNITTSSGIRRIAEQKDLFNRLKSMGYSGIDMSFLDYTNRDFILTKEYEDYVAEHYQTLKNVGLCVTQTHLAFWPGHLPLPGNGSYEDYEAYMLPILIREIELTAHVGCHLAVIHLYFEEDAEKTRKNNISLISKLLPYLEKYQVTLALENIFGSGHSDVHFTTAEELLYYPQYFQSPYIGVCLDTGHAVTLGQDPVKLANELGGYLKAIHAHTTRPGNDMHVIPYLLSYGEKIDWKAFYQTLCRINYDGNFNLELTVPAGLSIDGAADLFSLAMHVTRDIIFT